MANKPLTQRVRIEQGNLIVEDCDSTTVTSPIPCTCEQNPDQDPGNYPTPPVSDLCILANKYNVIAYNITAELKKQFDVSGQPDNLFGWWAASIANAANFQLPGAYMGATYSALADSAVHDSFFALDFPQDGIGIPALYLSTACAFYNALVDNFGVLDYDILRMKLDATGQSCLSALFTAIPLADLNNKLTLYLSGVNTDYGFAADVDCADCASEGGGSGGTSCTDCGEAAVCHLITPDDTTYALSVTGYTSIADQTPSGHDKCFISDGDDLLIDLGENRCISQIILHCYSSSSSPSPRSTHHRIELDDQSVTNFMTQAGAEADYNACGGGSDALRTIFSFDGAAYSARYIKIVGNRSVTLITQIDLKVCE